MRVLSSTGVDIGSTSEFTIRTKSARAAHAAIRFVRAVEMLERIDAARHAEIMVKFEGRKITLWIPSLCLGASTMPEIASDQNSVE